MENKHIIIILIVIIVLLSAVIAFLMIDTKNPSKIKITSDNTLFESDTLTFKLTDLNKTPISKEKLSVIVSKDKNVILNETVKTDSKGKASLDFNLDRGDYIVKVLYNGNENFTGNDTTQRITVEEVKTNSMSATSQNTVIHDGSLTWTYKDGRWGFYTPAGNFFEA